MMDTNAWHQRYLQQAAWTREIRQYLLDRSGLAENARVLDAGCGTGALFDQFDQTSHLHGLDINNESLVHAQGIYPLANLTQGNVYRLPYPDDSFDLVYCHYLLLWLSDQTQPIREFLRVVRPGGWLLSMAEPDHLGRIDHPAAFIRLGQLQTQALHEQGADTGCGRKLAGLFHQAGLTNVESGVLQGQWHQQPTQQEWQIEWTVLENDLADRLSPAEINSYKNNDWQAWLNGERVMFIPTFYAMGQKI